MPLFLIVTLLQAIKNISDGMIVQRISRRNAQATDFRLIQGSIYANGTGILMSGVAGTPPTSTYSSLTVALVNVTGNAARATGYAAAVVLVLLALFPKVTGALITIPSPVMGGFLIFAIGLLLIEGIQTFVRSGLDPQKSLIAGLSFAVGLAMHQYNLLADFLPDPVGHCARQRHHRRRRNSYCPNHIRGSFQTTTTASRNHFGIVGIKGN